MSLQPDSLVYFALFGEKLKSNLVTAIILIDDALIPNEKSWFWITSVYKRICLKYELSYKGKQPAKFIKIE